MTTVLFFIENLYSGGKERRLVQLLKGLHSLGEFRLELVLTEKEIHYTEINELGLNIHILKRGCKKDPRLFWGFYKLCRNIKPDLIHVWGNMVALYAIPAKVILRIPLINNQIADAPLEPKKSILHNVLPFLFADKLIANSIAGKKAYELNNSKCAVIYNGFDFSRVSALRDAHLVKQELGLSAKKIVGMVANLTEKKDYPTFIRAANEVLRFRNDVQFVSVGSGDPTDLAELVEEAHRNSFFFIGRRSDIENIVNIFSVGILSTFTEGISNSVMEYMALAKPVVVTRGGGSEELVVDGVTGILVPPRSPSILAQKILLLLENEDLCTELGRKGFERLSTNFNLNRMVEDFIRVYKNILKI